MIGIVISKGWWIAESTKQWLGSWWIFWRGWSQLEVPEDNWCKGEFCNLLPNPPDSILIAKLFGESDPKEVSIMFPFEHDSIEWMYVPDRFMAFWDLLENINPIRGVGHNFYWYFFESTFFGVQFQGEYIVCIKRLPKRRSSWNLSSRSFR